jgi:hypothetical protein
MGSLRAYRADDERRGNKCCSSIGDERWSTHARSQGGASECNAPTTNLEAATTNLQNIKDKPADQPAKKLATSYYIHVLRLLNGRGWKQLIFKNVCIHPMQDILCSVIERIA